MCLPLLLLRNSGAASDDAKSLARFEQQDIITTAVLGALNDQEGEDRADVPWATMSQCLWVNNLWWDGTPIDFNWQAFSKGSVKPEDGSPVSLSALNTV